MAVSAGFIIVGLWLILFGAAVISNVRGFGDSYARLSRWVLRRDSLVTERWVYMQRIYFAVVMVIGLAVAIVGVTKL